MEDGIPASPLFLPPTLAECGRLVLCTADPLEKCSLTHASFLAWCRGSLSVGAAEAPEAPARPPLPRLVPAKDVPTPSASTLPLAAHLLHGLAHVELNAIDLAWDTVVRFSSLGLPPAFYADFARVADDESRHLQWCLQRLSELGHVYGDMDAHGVLWEGAVATRSDVLDRLAIVPCVQEARGLDAGPRLAERLVGAGDNRTAAIVRRIADEELAHVAVGVHWLRGCSQAAGRDPRDVYRAAVQQHYPGGLKGSQSFNVAARERAGLHRSWWQAPQAAALVARLATLVATEASHGDEAALRPCETAVV